MPTGIAYVDKTWNPEVGCTKCSPGCLNCYAEKMAYRLVYMGHKKYEKVVHWATWVKDNGGWTGEVVCDEKVLDIPLHWRKPRRILVCSMGDLFHKSVPFEFIKSVLGIIALCPQHKFLLLTKRIEKMAELSGAYPDNAFPGATICNQEEANRIIPILLQIQAAHRWLSIEPMLEAIKLSPTVFGYTKPTGQFRTYKNKRQVAFGYNPKAPRINSIIVGCESGPKRRPCKLEHIRSIVQQCKAAGVRVFVKQIEIDGKVSHNPDEWPEWARVRETI